MILVVEAPKGGLPDINEMVRRLIFLVLVVAVANKLARIAWAVLARGELYRSAPVYTTG